VSVGARGIAPLHPTGHNAVFPEGLSLLKLRYGRVSARLSLVMAVSLPLAAQARESVAPPSEITVNGILPSVDRTYRVESVEIGPLGVKPLLDIPYSISIVPVQLAENQQLESVRELFRYIPSVQGENSHLARM
jgi:iron complex outermembrane receptor protein